jgi:hypothetical protein
VGAQNNLRYAVFPDTRRLVIDDRGAVSVYDTGDHRIFGVAQAQSSDRTLSFTSQDGLVKVRTLRRLPFDWRRDMPALMGMSIRSPDGAPNANRTFKMPDAGLWGRPSSLIRPICFHKTVVLSRPA